MTIQEMFLRALWRCSDFCHFDCFPRCEHELGYQMYVLAMEMLETDNNPLI